MRGLVVSFSGRLADLSGRIRLPDSVGVALVGSFHLV
jgi:hypothetical protein